VSWEKEVQIIGARRKIAVHEEIDLGRIDVPTDNLIRGLRTFLQPLRELDAIVQGLANVLEKLFQAEAQQAATAAQETQVRADLQQDEAGLAESSVPGLDITIVEPAPGGLYDKDVALRIDIAQAPLAFLGRNPGEKQRILVWVNQQLLDLNGLQAAIVLPALVTDSDGTNTPTGGIGRLPMPPVSRPAAPVFDPNRLRLADATLVAHALVVSNGSQAASVEEKILGGAVPIGRVPDATELKQLDVPPTAVLRLTGLLPLASLVDGLNTIVVAATDGSGKRIDKAASFIASESRVHIDVQLPEDTNIGTPGRYLPPKGPSPVPGGLLRAPRAARAATLEESREVIEALHLHLPIDA
jgi:hypothetical protein